MQRCPPLWTRVDAASQDSPELRTPEELRQLT